MRKGGEIRFFVFSVTNFATFNWSVAVLKFGLALFISLWVHVLAIQFAAVKPQVAVKPLSRLAFTVSFLAPSEGKAETLLIASKITERSELNQAAKAVASAASIAPQLLPFLADLPQIELLTRPDEYYFSPTELDEKALVSYDTASALALNLPGVPAQTVVLMLFINEIGRVDRVEIQSSHLPDHGNQMVIDAFLKMKFQPAQIGKIPVKSQMKISMALDDIPL